MRPADERRSEKSLALPAFPGTEREKKKKNRAFFAERAGIAPETQMKRIRNRAMFCKKAYKTQAIFGRPMEESTEKQTKCVGDLRIVRPNTQETKRFSTVIHGFSTEICTCNEAHPRGRQGAVPTGNLPFLP